jgi:hypothetical protein
MALTKGKNQAQQQINDSFETVKEHIGFNTVKSDIQKSLVNDVGKGMSTDFMNQLLGINLGGKSAEKSHEEPKTTTSGAIEIFNLFSNSKKSESARPAEKQRKPESRAAAAIDYHRDIVRSSEKASRKEVGEMNHRVQELMVELRKLVQSSKGLEMQFARVAVETKPKEVGQYHLNFFDWMIAVIRTARMKVEDSGAWLGTVKGKNTKGKVKTMFQKGGTSATLSNERTAATQTG